MRKNKQKTVYILSLVEYRSDLGYVHTTIAVYNSSNSALNELRRLRDENERSEFVIEPWFLQS